MNYVIKRATFLLADNDSTSMFIENTNIKIRHVVAVYSSINNVKPSGLKNLFNHSWNSRANFLLWILENSIEEEQEQELPPNQKDKKIEGIMTDFWALDCLNVVLMINQNSSFAAFTYDPFTINKGSVVSIDPMEPFFTDKTKNLREYPIAVSMYQAKPISVNLSNFTSLIGARGVDVEAMRYISTSINFSVVLKSAFISLSGYSYNLPDGTVIGPIGDIISNRSEILGNPQIVNTVLDRDLEFLRPFGRSLMMIAVPTSSYMPGVLRLFRTVDHDLTMSMLGAYVVLMLCLLIIKKRNPLLETARIVIQQQCHEISNRVSERIFMMSWIIWAFILASAGQVHLMKALTDPPFYPNINTLDELVKSDLTVILDPIVYRSLNHSEQSLNRKLIEKAEQGTNFDSCLIRLSISERVACVTEKSIIRYQVFSLNRKIGKKKISTKKKAHIVKSPVSTFWKTLVVRKGFPFLDKFDKAYQNIVEFGLIFKWTHDIGKVFKPKTNYFGPLNLIHFEGIFIIFGVGISLAIGAFIGEIVVSYIKYKMI
ncbi:uncharacterized protein LOC123265733 [Cotesia glomerata]|nr:uncharacterized protein LOC123265733 [Cotesia glomerata]